MISLASLEKRTRDLLSDAAEPHRWSKEKVQRALCDAVRMLFHLRPSTRYYEGELVDCVFPEVGTEEADEWEAPVNARHAEALTYYAAARCLEMDGADTANRSLSERFFTQARERMEA